MDQGVSHPEVQTLFLSAVHQARQPLLVIEYALFAASHLVQRHQSSPDVTQIQRSLTEMGAVVDSLTSIISVIAGIAKPGAQKPVEAVVSGLVKEAFEMASFCLRRDQEAVNYDLDQTLSGLNPAKMVIDYPTALLALIRWILETASRSEFHSDSSHSESLTLFAFSSEGDGDVTIQIRNPRHQQRVLLRQVISSATDQSNTSI
ncbi:MAG: hypothetical protein WCH39_13505 [Schlesneria sp.]